MLPIVHRELQSAARNPKLYRRRTIIGLGVVFIIGFILLFSTRPRHISGFFETLSFLAILLCLVEGIRKTSDSISIEKREGTLGLLFLSNLSGLDIILGKLTSATLRSLSNLLAFVPILAMCLLAGGTTVGEFWRTTLILILTLLLSLSLCLCVSTCTREGSLFASIFLLISLCLAPFFSLFNNAITLWILPLSPIYAHRAGFDSYYTLNPSAYWLSAAYLVGLSLASLALASFILPRTWQDRPAKARANPRLTDQLSPRLTQYRRSMLDRNPVMWLLFNPRSHRHFRLSLIAWSAFIILGTVGILYVSGLADQSGIEFLFPSIGLFAIVLVASLRVARSTSHNFFEARSNGALELILSTPIKVRDVLAGQWLALRADLLPALVSFLILSAILLIFSIATVEPAQSLFTFKALVEAALGIAATAAVGIWMGLTSKTPGRAFFKTVAFGFIAPHLICTPTLVNQIVLFLLAFDKVTVHFRRFVAEQYLATGTLAPVSPAPSNAPPVIRQTM